MASRNSENRVTVGVVTSTQGEGTPTPSKAGITRYWKRLAWAVCRRSTGVLPSYQGAVLADVSSAANENSVSELTR